MILRSPDNFSTSLNELGLDTPPVTPGSGCEIAQKESVLVENLCSSTSLNLGTNNLAKTKSNSRSLSNVKKPRFSNSRECANVRVKSGEIKVDGKVSRKRGEESQEFASNGVSSDLVNNKKNPSNLISLSSLSDNSSFESLDNRLLSSEEFIDPPSTAEAATESVFDVQKSGQKNLFSDIVEGCKVFGNLFVNPNDESTVKCTKWLSDNKKNAICADHSYSFNKSSNVKIIYKPGVVLPLQIPARSPQSDSSDNSGGAKRLLRIKSIERANIKVVGSRKDCQANSSDAVKKLKGTQEEKLILTDTQNRSEVVDSKILPDNCSTAWENNSGILRTENRTVLIDGLPPISLSYQIPSFLEESVLPSGGERDRKKEEDVKIEPCAGPGENKFAVANNLEGVKSSLPATNSETEQSMKKPLKRTIHKATKYQGFNFGALKKKSKSNTSRNEESNKTSILNLPSPDNVSTCSDLTYTSETSCATSATGTSRSESVSSSMDSSSKLIFGMDNFSSMTTSSDQKSMSRFSPENNDTIESNLNLDSVLDELLFEANESLPQNLGDDWLTSLFD